MKILVSYNAIAQTEHRHSFSKISFDDFWDAQENDKPVTKLVQILEALSEQFDIVIYAAFPERYRYQIEGWLVENGIPAEDVILKDNYDKAHIWAVDVIMNIDKLHSVIENDPRIIEALRDEEITCLEVA